MSTLADFVTLFESLDRTTATTGKRRALQEYLQVASPTDAVWAIYFLTGRRMRRSISGRALRDWAAQHTGLPPWLIEESYHVVGDLAETLAILCARGSAGEGSSSTAMPLAEFVEREILPLAARDEMLQRDTMLRWWRTFDERTCLVVHKLVTGEFRVGVSATLVAKSVGAALGREAGTIEHRLMGTWHPDAAFAERLFSPDDDRAERSRPYPFFLASPLDEDPDVLGPPDEWFVEWKWDGIRCQLITRGGEAFIWSRGEELITDRFPELASAARALPDGTVLDGEILPWGDDRPRPFSVLQTRIGRKSLSARFLQETPVVMVCFDLLELAGADVRGEPLRRRRAELEALVATSPAALRTSTIVSIDAWEELAVRRNESRARGVEGLMLKRRASPYRVGRVRGDWWKWKIAPYTMDAVMVYAQAGHGRRAALYTDYTFAVWDGEELVPVAKAYSGLDDKEIARLDAWIRANTTDRFGPVRAVTPHHVFEIGFETIQRSTRHKSGIAVRFPRILRWRADKSPRDADTLDALHRMIDAAERENPARAPRVVHANPSLFDDVGPADA